MGQAIVIDSLMTKNEYVSLHVWVRKCLGTPSLCENCGTDTSKKFEWANLSGEYRRELDDWARLCKVCHCLIDNTGSKISKDYCKRGHEMKGDNVRFKSMHGGGRYRYCKACSAIHWRDYYHRRKNMQLKLEGALKK